MAVLSLEEYASLTANIEMNFLDVAFTQHLFTVRQ